MIGSPVVPHVVGLPIVPVGGCPGGSLDPVCAVTGNAASGIAAAGATALLGAVSGWVAAGATWLLGQIGDVLSATTSVDVGADWFRTHFSLMVAVAGVVVLPLLLVSVIQAVYRQSASLLLRSLFVNLPLAVLLTFAALTLVQMGLEVTDDLSRLVASGSGTDLHRVLAGVSDALSAASASSGFPAFVLLLGALVVALGAFALFVELTIRAAAVYVAVLFLPLALATLVWPAISHACRRLVELLVALILSKFVIVSILCLSLGALGSGSGFRAVLAGAALLLLAAFSPFALLRLVPLAEFGAAEHLDAVRHRASRAVTGAPRSSLNAASLVAQLGAGSLEGALAGAGVVGSGAVAGGGADGDAAGARPSRAGGLAAAASGGPGGTSSLGGVGPWPGDPSSAVPCDAPAGASEGHPQGPVADPGGSVARYEGPLPVVETPAPRHGADVQGRATIERDALGPTIRFVQRDTDGGRPQTGPGPGPSG
jgi:hypothetical protein